MRWFKIFFLIILVFSSLYFLREIEMNGRSSIESNIFLVICIISYIVVFKPALFKNFRYFKFKEQVKTNIEYPEGFNEIYSELNNKYKNVLFKARRMFIKRKITDVFRLAIGIAVIILVIVFISMIPGNAEAAPGAIMVLILGYIFYWIFTSSKKNYYLDIYKDKVVKVFINMVDKNLIYEPKCSCVEEMLKMYKEAKIDEVDTRIDIIDDYIFGKIDDKTNVKIVNVAIEDDIKDSSNTRFSGLWACIETDHTIDSEIKITRNHVIRDKNNVNMDSQMFEKYFDVIGKDSIMAMRILTHDFMEELTEFYNKYQIDFDLIFKNNYIYMRFYCGDVFEPKMWGEAMEKDVLFSYYCIIKFAIEISKKTNKVLKDVII